MPTKPREARSKLLTISAAILSLVVVAPLADASAANVADIDITWARAEFRPTQSFANIELTVAGPGGVYFKQVFAAGDTPAIEAFPAGGSPRPDGSYRWQLVATPRLDDKLAEALTAGRDLGDPSVEADREALIEALRRDGRLPEAAALVQSGSLAIAAGKFVLQTPVEDSTPAQPPARRGRSKWSSARRVQDSTVEGPADQVIPDDLIVQGSACFGFDCVNNEAFGSNTVRLKENNTRIAFDDTSGAGFPARDWQLTANDSAGGGQEKFSIEDVTAARVPFTILGAAPTDSIFVDSTGRVGFRTATPVLDLHVATSNTPAHRLEQTAAGGFTPQTWDIGANEANFFVRDVTGGSRLPLRIRPGAPTSSLDIAASGKVGVGTASPAERLHVREDADVNTLLQVENPNAGLAAAAVLRAKSNAATVNFQAHASTRTINRFGVALGGWNEMLAVSGNGFAIGTLGATPIILGTAATNRVTIAADGKVGIGVAAPVHPLQMASTAHVTAGGVWTNASSRDLKQDIKTLSADAAKETVAHLNPVTYAYRADPEERHVGFIAEDVPTLVATRDRKSLSPMDIVAVLTKVVQRQQETIDDLQTRLAALEAAADRSQAVRYARSDRPGPTSSKD